MRGHPTLKSNRKNLITMSRPIIKSHTFAGRKLKIDLDPDECDGLVDCPFGNDAAPTMRIFGNLNTKAGLETVIHETLHVLRWSETETVIDKTANELARFLWRLNYRIKK